MWNCAGVDASEFAGISWYINKSLAKNRLNVSRTSRIYSSILNIEILCRYENEMSSNKFILQRKIQSFLKLLLSLRYNTNNSIHPLL